MLNKFKIIADITVLDTGDGKLAVGMTDKDNLAQAALAILESAMQDKQITSLELTQVCAKLCSKYATPSEREYINNKHSARSTK